MPVAVQKTPLAEDRAAGATALVILDMLSDWEFPDADQLLRNADALAPRIAALKTRCVSAGVPVIYANDNRGRWRSDFRDVFAAASQASSKGAPIARLLAPQATDYFVLKPKHSAFYATPLDLLLRHLRVQSLVVTGVTSDQCVLHTVADAKLRDYEVTVPRDGVASISATRQERVLKVFAEAFGIDLVESRDIRMPGRTARSPAKSAVPRKRLSSRR